MFCAGLLGELCVSRIAADVRIGITPLEFLAQKEGPGAKRRDPSRRETQHFVVLAPTSSARFCDRSKKNERRLRVQGRGANGGGCHLFYGSFVTFNTGRCRP